MNKISGNIVKAEDVIKYARCGGYHGNTDRKNLPVFNAEETCYGNYMYLLEEAFNLRVINAKNPKLLQDEGLNAEINKVVGTLEKYVMENCFDRENRTVNFSARHFIDAFSSPKNPALKTRKHIASNFALMPYVIQYVLMQNGYYLEDRNKILKDYGETSVINGMRVSSNNPHVRMVNTQASIDKKREDFEEFGK